LKWQQMQPSVSPSVEDVNVAAVDGRLRSFESAFSARGPVLDAVRDAHRGDEVLRVLDQRQRERGLQVHDLTASGHRARLGERHRARFDVLVVVGMVR
jgi:hypothetical protein